MYRNQISWNGAKDFDTATEAFVGKYFCVIYTQISVKYDQCLIDSLTKDTGNFNIFLFAEELLKTLQWRPTTQKNLCF